VWSSMGEVVGVVVLRLGLHRAQWVRSPGAAHLRRGERCGGAYLCRSSSLPLLCHARAASPLLAVVPRPPPSWPRTCSPPRTPFAMACRQDLHMPPCRLDRGQALPQCAHRRRRGGARPWPSMHDSQRSRPWLPCYGPTLSRWSVRPPSAMSYG
jgi:hypothetical protein